MESQLKGSQTLFTADSDLAAVSMDANPPSGIEQRSIDYVSSKERYGKASSQVPIWFMGQFQLVTLSLGFIGPSMGLSFFWSIVAGVFGTLLGTVFMALHATQGPIMGLPQMIQSRAQFGYRGVIIPLIAVLIDFVGYNIICAMIISTGLHKLFGVSLTLSIIVSAVLSGILAIYGHEWVHRTAKWLFWINLPAFGLLTLGIATGVVTGTTAPAATLGFSLVAFGTQFAAAASNAIAYAPFVSDYSRYMKRSTPSAHIIGAVFVGSTCSGIWMMGIGAWLAIYLGATDPVGGIQLAGNSVSASAGTVMAIIAITMNVIVLIMNTYSSSLAVITISDSLKPTKPSKAWRIVSVVFVTLVWAFAALAGGDNIVDAAWLTLTVLLYVLVPWTAVNLVDFFFVRHGRYAITHLFRLDGIYGQWAWRGLLPYTVGLVCMVPFAVLPHAYTGPIAEALGGIDVAWIVGLIVSGGLYKLVAPSLHNERDAIAQSERELEGGSV